MSVQMVVPASRSVGHARQILDLRDGTSRQKIGVESADGIWLT